MYQNILIAAAYCSHDGGRDILKVILWAEMSSISTLPKTPTLLANIRLHKHAVSGAA
jgi:hypothetical protein